MVMDGFMRTDDAGLKEIVNCFVSPEAVVVEIGCYAGESTEVFAQSLKVKKLLAVDPWADDYDPELKLDWKMDFIKKSFDKRMAPYKNVEVMQMTSEKANKLVPDNSVDLVYIDGDHRYEFVKQDIQLWLPKLKDGGIISGHDFLFPSVAKAVMELIGHPGFVFPGFVFSDGSWLNKINRIGGLKCTNGKQD